MFHSFRQRGQSLDTGRKVDPALTLIDVDTVRVPFRLRVKTRNAGFAGSGRTSSVSFTPRGTVSSIRENSAEQVALNRVLDAAKLKMPVMRRMLVIARKKLTPS
jgi:hypothetical protein